MQRWLLKAEALFCLRGREIPPGTISHRLLPAAHRLPSVPVTGFKSHLSPFSPGEPSRGKTPSQDGPTATCQIPTSEELGHRTSEKALGNGESINMRPVIMFFLCNCASCGCCWHLAFAWLALWFRPWLWLLMRKVKWVPRHNAHPQMTQNSVFWKSNKSVILFFSLHESFLIL